MQHDDPHAVSLPQPEPPELETIRCELANGHAVRIEARYWYRLRSIEDWTAGIYPEPYYAIRFYCSEGTLPKRLVWSEEFRAGTDFDLASIRDIWDWLAALARSRLMFEFDDFADFIHHFADGIDELSVPETDADEHYHQLPALIAPQWFDRIDDSVFNDQNDGERDT